MTVSNQTIIDALFVIEPSFITTDPVRLAQINSLIDLISCMICEDLYGNCYVLAYAYLLAHFLYMADNGPTIGAVSSLSEGGLSISYDTSATNFNGSIYGRQFLSIPKVNLSNSFAAGGYPNCALLATINGYRNWGSGGCC